MIAYPQPMGSNDAEDTCEEIGRIVAANVEARFHISCFAGVVGGRIFVRV